MASNTSIDMKALEESFGAFAIHGKSAGKKTEMDGKNWSKCCKDCKVIDGKSVTSTDVDIVFSKVKPKGARVIGFGEFQTALTELAAKKYKAKDAQSQKESIFGLIAGKSPQNLGVTKTSKTGGVDKMTDASQYTGSHKERFDASGKGKGKAGREDLSENTGYVGNYKGEGTYEKKTGN